MGVRRMKGQKEYQEQVKDLEKENNNLLKQIEFILTKGTSEFLSNTRALIEKNVSKRREHQYQEPINKVAYRVCDKESYLKRMRYKKIN